MLRPTVLAALVAVPAMAEDNLGCELYEQCCLQYVTALEEAGQRADLITATESACSQWRALPDVTGVGATEQWCILNLEFISELIWEQYQAGYIGYFPAACVTGEDWVEPD